MNKTYRLVWSHQQQKLVAVSESTRGRGKCGGRAPTLLAAAVAAAFSFAGAAQAACDAGPNTFTCSGAEASTRTLSGSPLSLTLDPTFVMTAAAGNGLTLTGTGGIAVTQAAGSSIVAGAGTAVDATNSGAGTGINLSLDGNISGSNYGIYARNSSGTTTIDTTGGTVTTTIGTALFSAGILARTSATSTDLTITTADVNTTGIRGSGIRTYNYGTGLTTIDTTRGTITASYDGVHATNGPNAGNLTITTAGITASQYGIRADNDGTGSTTIDTTRGAVSGSNGNGIIAINYPTAANLTITTANVTGNGTGIIAYNYGTGSTTINTTAGAVSSTSYRHGIDALNDPSATDLTITTANVTGVQYGMRVQNSGTGATTIDTTAGTVAGGTRGIQATNGATATDLTITTANVTASNGIGINAQNNGSGATVIDTIAGTVTSTTGIGLNIGTAGSGNLTITTGNINAGTHGIRAEHSGTGALAIDTRAGSVTTGDGYGIYGRILNAGSAASLTITTGNVSSQFGVSARQHGTGSITIDTTAGEVTASVNKGVAAYIFNPASSANITITTGNVTGGFGAVVTYHDGSGDTTIDTTAGAVVSPNNPAILGEHGSNAKNLSIIARNASGYTYGIQGINRGTGSTSITVAAGGVVQGRYAGIRARHASASPFTITVNGEVRNDSGLASDQAILANSSGRGVTLQNNSNTIIGTVFLTDADDTFNNVGSWFTENGTSTFEAGNDVLNNSGFIRAANNVAAAETTRFDNLELFNHSGIVTLQDGAVGDRLITSGNFAGSNGEIRLDTVLDSGAGGSDVMEINGNASGNARLRIANAGGHGGKTSGDGILVVQVNGTSTPSAFSLAAPVNAGIWNYQLDYGGANNTNQNWYLVSRRFNEVGALYESTPRILLDALQPIATLQQRIGQRQVHGESGEQGAWVRLIGEWRDTTAGSSSAGSRWKTQTRSLQGGYDHLLTRAAGGDLALGVTAHYHQVDADIRNAVGRGSLDGESYGGGLTLTWYGRQGSYVDLQAAASRNRIDLNSARLGTLAQNKEGTALTLSAEAGHRLALNERHTLIPQFQWQGTRLKQDDFTDQQGNRVVFGEQTNHLARAGLAWEIRSDHQDRFYLIGNLLHNFTPNTDVLVNGTRLQADSFRNAAELGFGGTLGLTQAVALYGEGNYRRSLDGGSSDGYLLTAGVRMSW